MKSSKSKICNAKTRQAKRGGAARGKRLLGVVATLALVASMIPLGALPERAEAADSDGNFEFMVEYYANLNTLVTGNDSEDGHASLSVIDTSGGKLPVNGTPPVTKSIYVSNEGDDKGALLYEEKSTQIYKTSTFNYYEAPVLACFDKVTPAGGFTLKEVWVKYSQADKSDASWEKRLCGSGDEGVRFTNDPAKANSPNTILLKEGACLRLIYDEKVSSQEFSADFYDYNITDGYCYKSMDDADKQQSEETSQPSSGDVYTNTKEQGINSSSNYEGNGSKLAFGNVNTGTGLGQSQTWDGNYLNKYNKGSFQGCTFGLVEGLDDNGNIVYAKGIVAPNLFGEGDVVGRKIVSDRTDDSAATLGFKRSGDTYTLTDVTLTDVSSKKDLTLSDLDEFCCLETSNASNPIIWTNNFWPVDDLGDYKGKDILFGDAGMVSKRFHSKSESSETETIANTYPVSDDGKDHNSYFGMSYEIEFELDDDYVGPLEYLFFGDDDMWVFLDDKLVCDIGGVHSSVGEYVNLWDYISKERNEAETHTLKFFYTERGASGSTCFMQFTIPGVTAAQTYQTGSLEVKKDAYSVSSDGSKVDLIDAGTKEYEFQVKLGTNEACTTPLVSEYPYFVCDAEGKVVKRGVTGEAIGQDDGSELLTVKLKDEETLKIAYLPVGCYYQVQEVNVPGNLTAKVDGEEGSLAAGTVSGNGAVRQFDNVLKTGSLVIGKEVTGNAGDENASWQFDVTLRVGSEGAQSLASSYSCTVASSPTESEQRTLVLKDGTGLIELKHGQTATIEGLPVGASYTVAERGAGTSAVANEDGYYTDVTLDGQQVKTGESVAGTITAESAARVSFVNDKNTVTVQKIWAGEGYTYTGEIQVLLLADGESYAVDPWSDPVTLSEANNWTHTWTNLKSGPSWTVVELSEDGSYVAPSEPEADELENGVSSSSDEGAAGESGVLSPNEGDSGLSEGENGVLLDSPLPGFKVTYGGEDPNGDAPAGGQLCTITNTLVPGSLVVSKTVAGNPEDEQKDWSFVITFRGAEDILLADAYKCELASLLEAAESGEVQELGFSFARTQSGDLELTGTLRHNQKLIVSGLPHGTTYKVDELEANRGGYKTRINGKASWTGVEKGTIEAGCTSAVDYVNTYDPLLPKTGDPLVMGMIGLGVAAVGGLAAALLARRRMSACRKTPSHAASSRKG